MEEAEDLQRRFQDEAGDVLDGLGISPEEVSDFERQNPGFLEDPENQQRILERMQTLE